MKEREGRTCYPITVLLLACILLCSLEWERIEWYAAMKCTYNPRWIGSQRHIRSVMTVHHPIAGLRCNNVDGKGSLEFQIFQVDIFSRGNLYNFCGCPSQPQLCSLLHPGWCSTEDRVWWSGHFPCALTFGETPVTWVGLYRDSLEHPTKRQAPKQQQQQPMSYIGKTSPERWGKKALWHPQLPVLFASGSLPFQTFNVDVH